MGLFDRRTRNAPVPSGPAFGIRLGHRVAMALSGGDIDPAKTAAIAPLAPGSAMQVAPVPGRRATDPRQERAAFFARRLGFVRNSYRFLSHQGARPPLVLERSLDGGENWEIVPPEIDPWGYQVLREIKPPTGTVADLIRMGLFLDDTVGEFNILDVTNDLGQTAFLVRNVKACSLTKRGTIVVKESPNARRGDGPAAMIELEATRSFRHWQPDEEWPLMATSSLIGMVDDCDTLWTYMRQARRESRSRLAMNNILWSPSEAHVKTIDVGGKIISEFDLGYAQRAAAASNDIEDEEIASVAPMSINTPGALKPPQIIEVPSLTADLLTYIRDSRDVVAQGLPLSTQSIFDAQQSKNHWGDWLADEKDLQTIGERLQRVLDSFSAAILRPAYMVGQAHGMWNGGDPAMWRIGFDPEIIRRTVDNSEHAKWGWLNGLVSDDAARDYLRLKPTDAPTDAEFAATIERRTEITKATAYTAAADGQGAGGSQGAIDPAAPTKEIAASKTQGALPAGGPVPNKGQVPDAAPPIAASADIIDLEAEPEEPVTVGTAMTVFDDRWLFGRGRER